MPLACNAGLMRQHAGSVRTVKMRLFHFLILLTLSILAGAIWFGSSRIYSSRAQISNAESAFEKREAAYRANNIGVALLEQYKVKEAVDSFRRALEIKPDLLIARINFGIALYYLPDAEAAQREAESAVKQDPNAPQPHYLLGLIARAQNRFDDAATEFQMVLKADPSDAGTNVNLGQIFVQQKKQPEAIDAFRKAVESEPYNETALYNLGLLLTRTGKREEGQQLIQKFQQLKASGAGIALGPNYLEGGHYAEAVVSTGAEYGLVDRDLPEVKFIDASSRFPARAEVSPQRAANNTSSKSPAKQSWEEDSKNLMAQQYRASPLLFDFDNDGDLDVLELDENAVRLWRNDGARFTDVTRDAGALNQDVHRTPVAAVAGDYDNDGRTDLLVVRYGLISLYHNDGAGKFSDSTKGANVAEYPYLAISAAFVDVDHDGDLDVFVAGFADLRNIKIEPLLGKNSPLLNQGFKARFSSDPFQPFASLPGAPNLLLRNNGDRTFTDITASARVAGSRGHAVAVVPTDFDNRRDIDLVVINYGGAIDLFRNQRDGSFNNVASAAGLNKNAKWSCVAAGDVNKDGFTDFFLGRGDGPGEFALSDGKTHFKTFPAPAETSSAFAAQFIDYDNDGLLDLVTVSASDAHLWRNLGDGWREVTKQSLNVTFSSKIANDVMLRAFASADVDADGDVDLLLQMSSDRLILLRNDGGNRNHSIRIDLHGKVSNRSAIEAKVELRAGSLYQKLETYSASPAPAPADLIFGLGKRERPDAVRVIWPAGILQAETEFPPSTAQMKLNITELDRKPSSCPYLYAWNGERFEFITDFMGGGEMGYLEEPGPASVRGSGSVPGALATESQQARYNHPDPIEYVRIRGDQLEAKDGRYELRVTNELEEAMFVDRLQLLAVAHAPGAEIYPNEGMSDPPKPSKLFMTQNAQPPLSAVDDKGNDVLDLISRMDRRWPDDFKVDRIRGYAEGHTLTIKLPLTGSADASSAILEKSRQRGGRGARAPSEERVLLLLTGWTDYAWSSDNVAASQAGKEMKPPSLQVKDRAGKWRTVIEDIGIPVGRPQTVTVDLTGKFLSPNREVRIVTNMRIYWDQILFATSIEEPAQITRLDPVRADLCWRGFSAEVTPDGREPFGYDYQRVSFASPWKIMAGRYTREGDVRELLVSSDDLFVIARTGDEIALSFDASTLPALPTGWTRTFLLYADGFSKEMDINSASPDQLAPMPFHAMTRYPYSRPEHYPSDPKHVEYLEKYNTRVVRSQVPLIDAAILGR